MLRGVGCLAATACRRQGCVLQTASKLCEGGKCGVAAVAQTLRGQQRASDSSETKCPRDTGSQRRRIVAFRIDTVLDLSGYASVSLATETGW